MADVQNGSNVCMTTHFGRKDDESCTHFMTIEDIVGKIRSAKPGEDLESDWLKCGNVESKLIIFPNGETEEYKGYISVHVMTVNCGKSELKSLGIFSAENSHGEFLSNTRLAFSQLLQMGQMAKGSAFPQRFKCGKFLPHTVILDEENSEFFPNGVLAVKAIIKVEGEQTKTSRKSKLPPITVTQINEELLGHFKKMLESRQFSDFQIICQEEIIPCHRNVLAARSEIFEAMLDPNNGMMENEAGEVKIKDFDVGTIKAIVSYMYTGEIKHNEENAEQILRAADKYRLEGLKKMIEITLIESLKIENAIEMFVLGDAVHADSLRDSSKEVIVTNAAKIVELDGWKEALGRFQDLSWEIFESIAKQTK